jgi:hypothetical protein
MWRGSIDIMQISGHKNVAFINNYSTLSEERHKKISNIRVGLKTGRRKTGRANFDIFLDITFLLLELFFKFKLICKVETNI